MKQLLEIFPYLVFGILFLVMKINFFIATLALLVLLLACSLLLYFIQEKHLTHMQWTMLIVTVIFSALTLIFRNEAILQWKLTIINSLFAGIFLIGLRFKKSPLEYLLGDKLVLPRHAWRTLTIAWAIFFLVLALINTWLIIFASVEAWVAFKSFWSIPISIVFVIGQSVYMMKFLSKPDVTPLPSETQQNTVQRPPK